MPQTCLGDTCHVSPRAKDTAAHASSLQPLPLSACGETVSPPCRARLEHPRLGELGTARACRPCWMLSCSRAWRSLLARVCRAPSNLPLVPGVEEARWGGTEGRAGSPRAGKTRVVCSSAAPLCDGERGARACIGSFCRQRVCAWSPRSGDTALHLSFSPQRRGSFGDRGGASGQRCVLVLFAPHTRGPSSTRADRSLVLRGVSVMSWCGQYGDSSLLEVI